LRAVCTELRQDPDARAGELAGALDPFVAGSHGALFAAPSSHRRDTHLTVYTLARLPEQLRPAAVLMILSHAWQAADASDGLRRVVLIDEAWLLLKDPVAEAFLFRLAKSARKHALALALVTQDAADLLSSELGTAVAANAATQILLRQSAQTLDAVADAFGLSAGETEFLRTAPRGNALLTGANGARTTLLAVAAPGELDLLHTGLH
jgi:type IV secretory pathway VirB4 component